MGNSGSGRFFDQEHWTRTEGITGRAVFPEGPRLVSIGIEQDRISYVSDSEKSSLDEPCIIFPGFLDIHVHAREYPKPDEANHPALVRWKHMCMKETFVSAGEAAINGGVTLFAAMPNDPMPPEDPASYSRKLASASSSSCPVILFAAATANSEPWANVPYKVYLDPEPSAVSITSWKQLRDTVERYSRCRTFFHSEDPDHIRQMGSCGPRWKRRPPEAEIKAVDRILELTAKFSLRTHICHVSTRGAVSLISDYNKSASDRVTCEVTPHHLFFSVTDEGIFGAGQRLDVADYLFDCNPPLRGESDRLFLLDALTERLVDIVASDHAPHTMDDKVAGSPGMPHLDTLGPFAGWLMNECSFPPALVAEILSAAPAKIMSEDSTVPRGAIQAGYSASFTVLNLSRSCLVHDGVIVGRGPLKTKCSWSPFSGISLPGTVVSTVVAGCEYVFGRS